jgi:hypothetical protein
MRELNMHEIELVSGGGDDQESSSPWWSAMDYNGDGDLYDEARNWFLGQAPRLGCSRAASSSHREALERPCPPAQAQAPRSPAASGAPSPWRTTILETINRPNPTVRPNLTSGLGRQCEMEDRMTGTEPWVFTERVFRSSAIMAIGLSLFAFYMDGPEIGGIPVILAAIVFAIAYFAWAALRLVQRRRGGQADFGLDLILLGWTASVVAIVSQSLLS